MPAICKSKVRSKSNKLQIQNKVLFRSHKKMSNIEASS